MEIFGFSGKLGSGKNYVAERMFQPMLPERKTILLAFANHFKIDAIVKAGLDRNKVFGKKDDHTRRVLQVMGTEEGRNKYGENIWINLAEEWRAYYEGLGYERAIIFDVRFPNEVEYIKSVGGTVVRIDSPQRHLATATKEVQENGGELEKILGHASETSLDGYIDFDLVIKNDPEDNAVVQVRDFLRQYAKNYIQERTFFVDVDDTLCECHAYYEDVIDKIEAFLDPFWFQNDILPSQIQKVYRYYISQMRGRVNTTVFIHNRFATDLAWALESTIQELFPDTHPKEIEQYTQRAYNFGMAVYDYPYAPLPGAIDAVRELTKFGKVVLFTLGDRLEQSKKIAGLGLSDLPFEVTHDKCVTTFIGLQRKYPAVEHYMIGDNMLRDIQPAIEAGIQQTYWIHPRTDKDVDTDDVKPYTQVASMEEAVHLITFTMRSRLALKDAIEGMAKVMVNGPDLQLMPRKGQPKMDLYFLNNKIEKGNHLSPFGPTLTELNSELK